MDWLKKILEDLGVTEVDKAVDSIKKPLGEHFVPRAEFNTKNDEVKKLTKTIEERDQQLSTLQTSAGNAETLKAEIAKLTEKNKADSEAWDNEKKQLKIAYAVDTALLEAKAKNSKAAKALLDLSVITIADSGTLIGLSEQLEKLKTDNEWLFGEAATGKSGKSPGEGSKTPPVGGKNPWSKEHYNLTEQAKIFRSDPEKARQLAKQVGKTI